MRTRQSTASRGCERFVRREQAEHDRGARRGRTASETDGRMAHRAPGSWSGRRWLAEQAESREQRQRERSPPLERTDKWARRLRPATHGRRSNTRAEVKSAQAISRSLHDAKPHANLQRDAHGDARRQHGSPRHDGGRAMIRPARTDATAAARAAARRAATATPTTIVVACGCWVVLGALSLFRSPKS